MKKNFTIVVLFGFLCVSLFLNLAAFGERIRLNGVIDEMNQSEEHTFKYVNAQSDLNNALYEYCQVQKDINAATLKNDDKRLMEAIGKLPDAVKNVDTTTEIVDKARDERSAFIKNTKYVSRVEMPYNRVIELPSK